MRTSEYYERGIHSFFTGYGLDALDRHRRAHEVSVTPEPEPVPGHASVETYDYDDVPSEQCECLATAYPPCGFCENDFDIAASAGNRMPHRGVAAADETDNEGSR